MSLWIIGSWSGESLIKHTGIDDFESFVWVLLWAVLCIVQDHGDLNPRELEWLGHLTTGSISVIEGCKSVVMRNFTGGSELFCSKGFSCFIPCFQKLFSIADSASKQLLLQLRDDIGILEMTHQYAQSYAETLIDAIPSLPLSWDYVQV